MNVTLVTPCESTDVGNLWAIRHALLLNAYPVTGMLTSKVQMPLRAFVVCSAKRRAMLARRLSS